MKKTNRITVLMGLMALAGCQEPFPSSGKISKDKPVDPNVPPPLVLDLQTSVMEFEEGKESQYTFRVYVDEPGKPVVEIQDLPVGAVFDESTLTLTWNPPFDAANDANNPEVITKSYPIRVTLSSSEEPTARITRTGTLLVKDSARNITITPAAVNVLHEGQAFEQMVDLQSDDFAATVPMDLISRDLPFGASIERMGPQRFRLRFTPDFSFAKSNNLVDSGGYFRRVPFSLTAVAPRTRRATGNFEWIVRDVRQAPIVAAPTLIADISALSFTVSGEDVNRERAPRFTLVSAPRFGQVSTTEENTAGNPNYVRVMQIRFYDIPPDQLGVEDQFVVRFCADAVNPQNAPCVNKTVRVRVSGTPHRSPVIGRDQWPLGVVKEVQRNTLTQVPLPVRDGDTLVDLTAVTVTTSTPSLAQITWANGVLSVQTNDSYGTTQFNVTGTSRYGYSTTQSMILRVLPPTRALPVIDRSEWPIGTVQEIARNREVRIPMLVRDGDSQEPITAVTVARALEQGPTATWENGTLIIRTNSDLGRYAFELTATSQYGVSQSIYLVVNVVPPPVVEPLVDRAQWPFGEIRDFRRSREHLVPLTITDPATGQAATDIQIIMQPNPVAVVTWENGILKIVASGNRGYMQFDLVARSSTGGVNRSSFMLQVN